MIRKWNGLLAVAIAAVATMTGSARAEYFDFTATSSVGTVDVGGGNSITLAGQSAVGAPHDNASGIGSDLAFGTISNVATGTTTAVNLSYSFTISVTDYASVGSTTALGTESFIVTGTITGSLGSNQSNLVNTFTGFSPATQVIGGATYTFSFPTQNFTPPGAETSGAFTGHLTATTVPEPASLALVGLGLAGFAGRTLARRKKA